MGRTCSMYGGEERCIQGFGGNLRERDHLEDRHRWEDNIKMGLQKGDVWAWTGSTWLRIGTGGGQL